jgi:hypothetical protein
VIGENREKPPLIAGHDEEVSQHEDENGEFGSVVPKQKVRYLHEFSSNLDETKINTKLVGLRAMCDC